VCCLGGGDSVQKFIILIKTEVGGLSCDDTSRNFQEKLHCMFFNQGKGNEATGIGYTAL
jgi:hypothetical protein